MFVWQNVFFFHFFDPKICTFQQKAVPLRPLRGYYALLATLTRTCELNKVKF